MASTEIDHVDRQILDLLVEDGRRTVKEIADLVGLSPARYVDGSSGSSSAA